MAQVINPAAGLRPLVESLANKLSRASEAVFARAAQLDREGGINADPIYAMHIVVECDLTVAHYALINELVALSWSAIYGPNTPLPESWVPYPPERNAKPGWKKLEDMYRSFESDRAWCVNALAFTDYLAGCFASSQPTESRAARGTVSDGPTPAE